MHPSPVVMKDSKGRLWRNTPNGLERIPQPFHYHFLNAIMRCACWVRW